MQIWRNIGLGGVCLLLLFACSKEIKPEEVALQAAKTYYDQLLHGDYDAFVAGHLHGDSVPEAYRRQLVLNMKMFMEQQKTEHSGIDSVSPRRAEVDTTAHTANAFIILCYSDSTREEVVVPLIEKNGIWYLR